MISELLTLKQNGLIGDIVSKPVFTDIILKIVKKYTTFFNESLKIKAISDLYDILSNCDEKEKQGNHIINTIQYNKYRKRD